MNNNKIIEWLNKSRLIVVLYIVLVIIILFCILSENMTNSVVEKFSGRAPRATRASSSSSTSGSSGSSGSSAVTTQATVGSSSSGAASTSTASTAMQKGETMVMPVHSILPSFNNPNVYFGAYLSSDKPGNHIDNFIYTNSLLSNRWLKPEENLALSREHVIVDLTYDSNKRLTAVGVKMENGNAMYDIFKKQTSNYKSPWTKVESNRKMRSLANDIKYGKVIGCSSYDGQIYENKNRMFSYEEWLGPINFDKPMRKVMFDKEGFMIGIGLIDNYIYKKKTIDWRESKWDVKNANKTKVYDLVYDKDGCFIATTKEGVKKQLHPDFGSKFVLLRDFDQEHEEVLDNLDIIKAKTGNEYLDEEFDLNTELGRDLKRIYEFKKVSKDLCRSKGKFKKGTLNPQKESVDSDTLNRQNDEINELYSLIDDLTNKLGV